MSYAINAEVGLARKRTRQVGAKGSPLTAATGGRLAYGQSQSNYGHTMSNDSMDAQVGVPGGDKGGNYKAGQHKRNEEVKKITTKQMQKDGVKVVVKAGMVQGVALSEEAILQLQRELPNMNPVQRAAAMRIIIAYRLGKIRGNVNAFVGADDATATAIDIVTAVDPTGITGKLVSIGKAVKSLFSGGGKYKAADADRKKKTDDFIAQFKAMDAKMQEFFKHPAWAWSGTTVEAAWPENVFVNEFKGTTPDSPHVKNWGHNGTQGKTAADYFYKGTWYPLYMLYVDATKDASKSRTEGAHAVDKATGQAGLPGGGTFDYVSATVSRLNDIMAAYGKAQPKPSQADVATAGQALTNSTDPKSQSLGTSITTAQNQNGKTETQATVDLTKISQYPTYQENTPIPANTPFVVGYEVGAELVKDVVPGDNVKKGDIVKSSVPVVIQNGRVMKADENFVKKVWGTKTGKMAIGGGGLLLLAGGSYLAYKMFTRKNQK